MIQLLRIAVGFSWSRIRVLGWRARSSRTTQGRTAILTFIVLAIALHVGFSLGMDHVFPSVRDPEYGRRVIRWERRKAENPERPMIALIGSSRSAMGVRPESAHTENGPLLFNFSMVGSGPIMQLMVLRRLLADGIRPDEILVEFWPAFLREDGLYAEEGRIDPHRLLAIDRPFVEDYFIGKDRAFATMKQIRRNPFYEHRIRIINQLVPSWVPASRRVDGGWTKLDSWGWLPGYERDLSVEDRKKSVANATQYFTLCFQNFYPGDSALRAYREFLDLCHYHKIPVRIIWLPESSEFRALYPKAVLTTANDFLHNLQIEFSVNVIDSRDWVPDRHLNDGFHLSQPGAAVFSKQLGQYLRGER